MTVIDEADLAARREAILAAWRGSPTRFREDANAEEDAARGYADRLLVELAQNAADAAIRAGVPGELRFRLDGAALSAANTGAPLDRAGVDALTSLRASAKEAGTTGRFGVGFAAVLAVTDEPEIRSRTGGLRFSAAQTRAAVAGVPHLAAEADRRGGRVPVLRLAWPDPTPPPAGYDTEVVLPLRDAAAVAAVREALAGFEPALLLALPGLRRVDLDGRVVDDEAARWTVARRDGVLDPALLADRPVEERWRTSWSVLAAVPADPGSLTPGLVYAPTPSEEPLTLPVLLIGSFPLDTARRRVADGRLADWLAAQAGEAIADLAAEAVPAVSPIVTALGSGFPAGRLDGAVRDATLAVLRQRAWLPVAEDSSHRVAPRDAVAVPDPLVGPLRGALPGVLPAGWWTRATAPALARLGVRHLGLADVVDAVAALDRPPSWWRALYEGLATEPDTDIDAFGALPVPLADGRTVTGPRGVLLPDEGLPAEAVTVLGLRVAHPDAVHPLLERLGAVPATPRGMLADPRVRAAVVHSYDEEDPGPVADAVLDLVSAAGLRPAAEPWLAELALPATDGDWYAAGELLLPGGRLAGVVASDAPFGVVALPDRDPATLVATGVLETFAVLEEHDVDDFADLPLDDVAGWAGTLPPGARVERLLAVRDLEWVANWAGALALLAEPGPVREALTAPCRVVLPDGRRAAVVPYTVWWLSRRPVLAGRRPGELRLPDATDLAGLFDAAPGDPELAALLGARRGLDDVLAHPDATQDLLERLADPARAVDPEPLETVYARIAATGYDLDPTGCVRVAPDRVAPAGDVVVLDRPWLLDRLGDRYAVAGGADPVAVAELLAVPLLSELPAR